MFPEVVAAASDLEKLPKMYNVIYGLGGADATVSGFEKSFTAVVEGTAEKVHYLGVRL
jgi:pyruvate ferredoxin oxidoreductase alpha subunit